MTFYEIPFLPQTFHLEEYQSAYKPPPNFLLLFKMLIDYVFNTRE